MKKLIILFFALITCNGVCAQSCLPGGITFTTQAQIDSFQIKYPGCISIGGDVAISGVDIRNLEGLNVLTTLGGSLSIYDNPLLTSIAGLRAMKSVNGIINLGTISWLSYPIGNPSLANLTGLEGLSSVVGLRIIGNNTLTDLTGLNNIDSISGTLFISGNSSLTSLKGLGKVSYIGEDLQIGHYTMYGACGNPQLSNLTGLEELTEIGNDLIFRGYGLINLHGLNKLGTIGNDLCMQNCDIITSLDGLDNLNSIFGSLRIGTYPGTGGEEFIPYGNPKLSNIAGLKNLKFIGGDLVINLNDTLSNCDVQGICDYLASSSGTVYISNNFPGCNSPEEVRAACLNVGMESIFSEDAITIYPNPATNKISITTNNNLQGETIICIFNMNGALLQQEKFQSQNLIELDVSALAKGIPG